MGAFDYLGWTETLSVAADAFQESMAQQKLNGKRFWVTGTVSDSAHQNLKSRGWEVRQGIEG